MQLSPSDPPSRVLHITQPVDGGVARVVTDLVRAQLADGLRVAVACPDGPLAPALRALGADVRLWAATRSPGPALVSEVRARWTVIPNGVDAGRFHPAAVDTVRAGIPLLAGVDPAAPLVVCVGRLCRQKGQDVLLAAWDAVLRQVPGARLVLVGDGPEGERLRALAPESVLFAGGVTDAVPWYQAADLVVLPSRWEGMALAPLEAMACGRPVVLSDVDGARESLPPGQEPVPVEDPAALAGAVARLLRDPLLRESLGHQGRHHVLTTHDVRHTNEAVADVYRELLGGTDGRRGKATECRESIHT
ncbi:glycosyltransferase family 4 protein [Streptomyces stelliscabiei]|uniref:Glycosyltransferase involved in cell wall biosynthesis n=1 Tax=Streptomyces stelliscabiei TaxID=146820 RepID=A0A8I0P747_9ACTN|nr:glycosyltransferase family 4 protein [Streptomyces stelliscabiei]MBE1597404.1 glycosyltransferase involved in cell wall biosynthesis [Streptomyces stelliscabiei]